MANNLLKITKIQGFALSESKKLAIELDEKIQNGSISKNDLKKLQDKLNKIYTSLDGDRNSFNGRTYVLYEAQALISWIENDEIEAQKLLNIAVDVKGDNDLYTDSANDLIILFSKNINTNTNTNTTSKTEIFNIYKMSKKQIRNLEKEGILIPPSQKIPALWIPLKTKDGKWSNNYKSKSDCVILIGKFIVNSYIK